MKLSLSWIKDFVNIPEDMDMKQLAYDLTMDTVEVEDVEYLADRFDHMVVGVIEDIEPHPNADKLCVCKVDIGDGEIKDIVCGGINLEKVCVLPYPAREQLSAGMVRESLLRSRSLNFAAWLPTE